MEYIALTEQQKSFFSAFGFIGLPGLMADRIGEITDAFEALFEARGGGHAGKKHDGTARSCILPFIDQSVTLSSLLDDPRILGIAKSLLGDDFNYMSSDGNYYVGDTSWHSDGWHPKIRHIKIAFYLDPVRRDTGALRVIPGSCHPGDAFAQHVENGIYQVEEKWNVHGRDIPCVALETNPGDILVFNHNIKHAAFGGSSNRRMFTINLCEKYPDEMLQDLRDYLSGMARFWIDRAYGDIMVETAGSERRRHLEQVMANDGHLAALSAKMRETMPEPSRG